MGRCLPASLTYRSNTLGGKQRTPPGALCASITVVKAANIYRTRTARQARLQTRGSKRVLYRLPSRCISSSESCKCGGKPAGEGAWPREEAGGWGSSRSSCLICYATLGKPWALLGLLSPTWHPLCGCAAGSLGAVNNLVQRARGAPPLRISCPPPGSSG